LRKRNKEIDLEEMMELYDQLTVPGTPHKGLATLTGSWTTRTKAWMDPDKSPMEGTGTCEQKILLEGRYLQQEYAGEMLGHAFTGINVIGCNNHMNKYVSTWIDSMGTGIYYFEGTASADDKIITQESSYDDPVRGPMVWRSAMSIVDDSTVKSAMHLGPKGGKEEKMMEMPLTRKQ
jgi:hypothetical protein